MERTPMGSRPSRPRPRPLRPRAMLHLMMAVTGALGFKAPPTGKSGCCLGFRIVYLLLILCPYLFHSCKPAHYAFLAGKQQDHAKHRGSQPRFWFLSTNE